MMVRAQVGVAANTQADWEWRLPKHLLPFFADFKVSAMTIALVDECRSENVIERERIKAAGAVGRPIRDKQGQRRVAARQQTAAPASLGDRPARGAPTTRRPRRISIAGPR